MPSTGEPRAGAGGRWRDSLFNPSKTRFEPTWHRRFGKRLKFSHVGRVVCGTSIYGTQAPVSEKNGVLVGRSQVWNLFSSGRIRSAMGRGRNGGSIPVCCPCAIQIRPFGLPYGLFFTTQGPESRRSRNRPHDHQHTARPVEHTARPVEHMTQPIGCLPVCTGTPIWHDLDEIYEVRVQCQVIPVFARVEQVHTGKQRMVGSYVPLVEPCSSCF